ncbi:MAG: DEAD/DEAH box helicase family protein [Gallionella sp.]|nr:DEAD/DEAH box helicase family protein [Gallionella sp.]
MALILKSFQQKSLDTLKACLEDARFIGIAGAYAKHAKSLDGRIPQYHSVEGFEEVPYLCLRLPTGGGKTLLSSHAIRIAGNAWLEQDFPLVLWLVPTNTIRMQTLEALSNPSHPYRQAIDDAYNGRVRVFDIGDVANIRPKDIQDSVCVVVGTLATLRVNDTDGRKIYSHNENFEPHFSRVPNTAQGLERIEDGADAGKIKYSFANLLCLHRPLVIMDEAHNARTKLTFEVLKRVSPACIVEFTATPDTTRQTGSNVLYRASASELKAEEMVKLPIVLTEHKTWQEAVNGAILTRKKLAELATNDLDRIRPLVLIQAENKDKPANIGVLKQHLIDNEKIPAESIAIATGTQRELDGINLFAPDCKIEVILTVEALKEGWDCSFAYVFCSVANIHSSKDVEQLLGRVLRMPFAKKRKQAELNRAYAHLASPSFADVANSLMDNLVSMGFEQEEASQYIEQQQKDWVGMDGLPLFPTAQPLKLLMEQAPDLSHLNEQERQTISVQEVAPNRVEVVVSGQVSETLQNKIVQGVAEPYRLEAKQQLVAHREYQEQAKSPSQRGDTFTVPRLCLWLQDELELAEKELFLDVNGWNPLDFPAELPEFRFDETAHSFLIDLDGDQLRYEIVRDSQQMDLTHISTQWMESDFVRWLDREVRQPDIRQEVLMEFLRRIVASLTESKRFDLATLARAKFILVKVLLEKIRTYRQQAYQRGYQETLFGASARVETSFQYGFSYDPAVYPAHWFYKGAYRFTKHFYPAVGEMDSKGEEFECAMAIDRLPQVKFWVRNLAGNTRFSFWLPTASDNFYPDFLALLEDGRLAVIEYKGKHLMTADDAKEKRQIGELWQSKSNGKGLFLMAEKTDSHGRGVYQQLESKVS